MKLLVALVKDGNTQNVRRQQVRRELQTAETRVNRAGQRLGQRRFARAGIIFQQHMSARRKGCQQVRSEERRVGKSVDLGGRRMIKKKKIEENRTRIARRVRVVD